MLDGLKWGFARFFQLVFPADCAVCGVSLQSVSRIPVCDSCLREPNPLVAEHFCRQCQTAFLNEFPLRPDGVCPLCRAGATNFERAYSYGAYEGSLATLVHLFKYRGIRTLSKPLGELMARGLPSTEQFDAIVPVPLHWRKKLSRGFNQADLLAQIVSRRMGIAVVSGLKRRRNTGTQAGLTNAMRRKNVEGAFIAQFHFDGKRVLLIDDVMTTGATVSAAAKALRRAGAARVTVLTLARVDRRMPAMLVQHPPQAEFAVTGAS